MKTERKIYTYDAVNSDIKKLVSLKYLKDPKNCLVPVRDPENMQIENGIEVVYNNAFITVIVSHENLKEIFWHIYSIEEEKLEEQDYFYFEDEEDLFEDGLGY